MEIVLVGEMPVPPPTRRQVVDADKGVVCLHCHRMPYPTAPREPKHPGEKRLSSIQITPPGRLRLLTPTSHPINQVVGGWSPDGKQVVYSVNLFKDDWDIWVMDADGQNRGPLVSTTGVDMAPDWRPDGEEIMFSRKSGENWDLWVVNRDGGNPIRLTTHPAVEMTPYWCPDGKRVAFDSDRMGNFDIWVLEVPE